MKHLILLGAILFFGACDQLVKNNPFVDQEPTTTDSTIRAKELNDSAIMVSQKNIERYGPIAIGIFEDAAKMDPTYLKPHVNKLGILIQLRKFDDALLCTQDIIKLKPNNHQIYLIRGILYRLKNEGLNAGAEFDYADKLYVQNAISSDSNAAYKPNILVDPALGLLGSDAPDSTQRANQLYLLGLTWNELKN